MLIENAKAEDLRKVTDIIRSRVKSCVAAAGTRDDTNGKGGGGPQIAQGGVPGEKVAEALKSIEDVLKI